MKKALVLAGRNRKEILRDPISFVFCLGFPLALLAIFRVINYLVGDTWMSMADLIPGVAVFGFSFIMLYMTLLVSKDRATSFLTRLYHAPIPTADFVLGYALPGVVLGVLQSLITFAAGLLVALIPGGSLSLTGVSAASGAIPVAEAVVMPYLGILTATLSALPMIVFFVGCGILFGTLLNERSAPGVSSAIITASGLLGGAWMPLAAMGGFETFCRALPFYPAVTLTRNAFLLRPVTFDDHVLPLITVTLYALVLFFLAVVTFRRAMQSDKR